MPSGYFGRVAALAVASVLSSACVGSTGAGKEDVAGGAGSDELPGSDSENNEICALPEDGWKPSPMRRLTIAEYDNAVEDMLGDSGHFAAQHLSMDEAVAGFAANVQVSVSVAEAEKLAATARAVAESAAERLPAVLNCANGQSAEACALAFVERFGRLAFRRNLEPDEVTVFSQMYKDKAKATDHKQGVRLVIEAFLQMPEFLYRPVLGSETSEETVKKLTGEEVASRLSFFLWSSVPDDALLDAATEGVLDSSDGIRAEVDRMLKDVRFERALKTFALQWLGLEAMPAKDDGHFQSFSEDTWNSAKDSIAKFFVHMVKGTDGNLEMLFTEPVVFVDEHLAGIYGTSAKTGFQKTSTEAAKRGGMFTQAALLANLSGTTESSPVKRGLFVRSRLLCQTPPPPPENAVLTLPPDMGDKTLRQRLEDHRSNPACAGCHAFFDPLGLAFENFDAVGAYRETDNGKPVDATGSLTETDVDGNFNDAMDLMNLLKDSTVAAECFTQQFYRFAVGRLESEADACVLKRLTHSMMKSGYPLRDVFSKIATSDAFRFVGRN